MSHIRRLLREWRQSQDFPSKARCDEGQETVALGGLATRFVPSRPGSRHSVCVNENVDSTAGSQLWFSGS